MMDSDDHDRLVGSAIVDRIGKTAHETLAVVPVHLGEGPRTSPDGLHRRIECPNELSAETRHLLLVPIPGVTRLGPRLWPKYD